MRRFLSVLLPLLAIAVLALPAAAAMTWCRKDPVIEVNGVRAQILVAVPDEYVPLVNGPIQVTIIAPRGTTRRTLMTDEGFNGHGETVKFDNSSGRVGDDDEAFDITVKASVPIDRSQLGNGNVVPVEMDVIPEHGPARVFAGTSDLTTGKVALTEESDGDEDDDEDEESDDDEEGGDD